MFKPAEMVDAQIPGGEFMNYFKNPTEYPNIFDWIYSSLEVFGEVTNGAGMIRPCGRLAFFHKFPEIRAALMRANENVQTQENREVTLNRYGATVDGSRTNVYIVCSLAGGTGSGMFLDAAFLARTIVDAPSITGFLMLPSVFTPDTNDRIYANAYAALKELEFYSLRKELKEKPEEGVTEEQRTSFHDFSVEWERGRRQNIVGPPFDTCYLIDNKTKNGGIIAVEKKAQLCDMIADAIFMDFSPDVDEFALLKRSVRVNLSQFLLNDLDYAYLSDSYNETFSYRFSTFGFSKIYIPTDRIRNACTYKLAEDMVDFWLKRNNPPPDIRSFVRDNLLPKLNLQVGLVIGKGGVNDFLTNLRADEAGRTVFGVIDQWTGERRTEFQETARNKDINIFRLISDRREQFRREYFDRSDPRPERWGTIVRRIKITNKNNYLDEIKGLLRQEIANLLNDSNVRFDLVIEYLMGITRILDEYIEHFDRASRRAEAVISELSDDVAYCMDVVGVVQSDRWWFRSIGLRNYINHTVNDMQELFTRQTQLIIFETAVEVCRELKQYIGSETRVEEKDGQVTMVREGLIQELRLLQEDLVGLKASLRRKFDAFDSVEESL
ncbi:MAG: tubulin-like doman-containing protein, partial [Candidatus Poribacteria bacterium]